jgi:hypothetical protein
MDLILAGVSVLAAFVSGEEALVVKKYCSKYN